MLYKYFRFDLNYFFLISIFYYLKVSGIPSGSKSINALTRQW